MPFTRLRLMTDYQAPTPLWAPADLGGFPLTRTHLDDLGLPCELSNDLLRWQAFFDEHHPVELCGWDSPLSCAQYVSQGVTLQRRLSEELPGARVDLDLWPVPSEDHHDEHHHEELRPAGHRARPTAGAGRA
ncbi:hypothetical protein [Kineococcus sp. SYSU DK004]|uniref:hypothetical protein n=1 Tax=Kineococcus sp. SYSU DK004 TaxID=3383125 RepID=UPI003D7E5413